MMNSGAITYIVSPYYCHKNGVKFSEVVSTVQDMSVDTELTLKTREHCAAFAFANSWDIPVKQRLVTIDVLDIFKMTRTNRYAKFFDNVRVFLLDGQMPSATDFKVAGEHIQNLVLIEEFPRLYKQVMASYVEIAQLLTKHQGLFTHLYDKRYKLLLYGTTKDGKIRKCPDNASKAVHINDAIEHCYDIADGEIKDINSVILTMNRFMFPLALDCYKECYSGCTLISFQFRDAIEPSRELYGRL